MKNKAVIYLTSAILLISLIGVCCYAVILSDRYEKSKLRAENEMKAMLNNAVSSLRSSEADLSKLIITTDRQVINKTLSTLALKAASCSQALSSLPILATGVQNTMKFANQLSSYCTTALHSEALPDNFDEQILSFFDTCREVNAELSITEDSVASGELCLTDISDGETVSDGIFGSIADDMVEYPSVIFDGPFSDGQEATTPKCARSEITEAEAAEITSSLGFALSDCEATDGIIPLYTFKDDTETVQITKDGGIPYCILNSRALGEATLSDSEVEEAAVSFAKKAISAESKIIWRENYDGYVVYNFAPFIEDTVLYPDIFKVKVAKDNGEIIGFEAKSYIMNNRERTLPDALISCEAARANLKNGFEAETSRRALISVAEKEELAYEFFGNYNGLKYAIYYSALDGRELVAFRIIDSSSGQMVI